MPVFAISVSCMRERFHAVDNDGRLALLRGIPSFAILACGPERTTRFAGVGCTNIAPCRNKMSVDRGAVLCAPANLAICQYPLETFRLVSFRFWPRFLGVKQGIRGTLLFLGGDLFSPYSIRGFA